MELIADLRNVQTISLDGVARSVARRTGENRFVVYDRMINAKPVPHEVVKRRDSDGN